MPPAKRGKLTHNEGAQYHAARLRKDLSVIFELPTVPLDVVPAEQPAAFRGSLYMYQRRSLARMLEIEQGTQFSVQIGMSTQSFSPKGGVVADSALLAPTLEAAALTRCQCAANVLPPRVCCAAVGMGKTAQLIALLLSRPPTDSSDLAALVLTPEHLCHQWRSEIARFAGDALSVELVTNAGEMAALHTRHAWLRRGTARVLIASLEHVCGNWEQFSVIALSLQP